MKADFGSIQIERVENGWVLKGFSFRHMREGFLPDGAMVARTPDELALIVRAWGVAQTDAEAKSES